MPKQKRREQQHLKQQPVRRRSYTLGGTAGSERIKTPFPMNLFTNVKVFYIAGAVIMIGSVLTAYLLSSQNPSRNDTVKTPTSVPTPTVDPKATPSATPSVTATASAKQFKAPEQVIDAQNKTYTATIKTSKGDVVLKLLADVAPATVNSFVFLAQQGYFDGITFHRVVSGFVIQAGDPTATGTGGPGYTVKEEPNQLPNKRGTLSMAKVGGAHEFGSQFFVNLKDNVSLDYNSSNPDKFYPFAEVTQGMDVVDAIGAAQTNARQQPVTPITIQTVTIAEAPKGQ